MVADDSATCWVLAGLVFWIATLPVACCMLSFFDTWERTNSQALVVRDRGGVPAAPGRVRRPGPGLIRGALASRPARWLGEVSYGVFLGT